VDRNSAENDVLNFIDILARTKPSLSFGGIPVVVNPYMAPNEVWLVKEGKRSTIHIHEGPQAGQTVEEWLTKPEIYRIVNLGDLSDLFDWPKVPVPEIKLEPVERRIGDWAWPSATKSDPEGGREK